MLQEMFQGMENKQNIEYTNEQLVDIFINLINGNSVIDYPTPIKLLEKLSNATSYNKNENLELLYLCSEKISTINFNNVTIGKSSKHYLANFLLQLVMCQNAYNLVQYNLYLLKYMEKYYLETIISKSKFNNFKLVFNYIKSGGIVSNIIPIDDNDIVLNACKNYDDRVFRFCVNNLDFNLCEKLFNNLLSRPAKYFLRRVKYIKNKINNNEAKLNLFRAIHSYPFRNNISKMFFKYYYDFVLEESDVVKLAQSMVYSQTDISVFKEFMGYLKTNNERNQFNIHCIDNCNIVINLKYLNFNKISQDRFFNIYRKLRKSFNLDNSINSKYFDIIIRKACESNHFKLFLNKKSGDLYKYHKDSVYGYYSERMKLYMLPYLKETQDNKNPRLNYLYIKLKTFIRRININKKIDRNIKFKPVLFELMNYHSSSSNIKLLKDNIQEFSRIPPHLMFPGEIETLTNFIVKEKADGELVYKLPNNIEPPLNIKYDIKAEYIEDLDLYLVFDINYDGTIINKYNYLRDKHYITNGKHIKTVNNMVELVNMIKEERELFSKFINQDYDNFRWYPKAAWNIITMSEEFINDIYDFINDTSIYSNTILYNDYYKNDGFIITQSDSDIEIKVKPKSLMTIDLEYDGENFIDRDNNIYDIKIDKSLKLKKGVFRCYPIGDNFIAEEFRFDKKKPNPYNVVNNIINLSKINYCIKKPIYYHNVNFQSNKSWGKIVSDNFGNLLNVNKCMYENKNILDLGCGISKVLKLNMKFTKYTGYDYDIYILLKNLKKVRTKPQSIQNSIHFNYIDLSSTWDKTIDKFYDVKYEKYMNVYAINSLMHFNTDIFWEQIDKVTSNGSRFLFNVFQSNKINNIYWKENNSYIKTNNKKVELFFENVHSEPIIEKYITIDDINNYLEKYNFKIIYKYVGNNNNITDLYDWYVCEKY